MILRQQKDKRKKIKQCERCSDTKKRVGNSGKDFVRISSATTYMFLY